MKTIVKNKVELSGFIGKDPEVRVTSNGLKMAGVSLATNDGYKSKIGEWVNNTNWHNLVAFGKVADEIETQVKKGSKIAIEGKLSYRQYEDKQGVKRNVTEINVFQIQLID